MKRRITATITAKPIAARIVVLAVADGISPFHMALSRARSSNITLSVKPSLNRLLAHFNHIARNRAKFNRQGKPDMDRNFQRALKLVLKHEGGWADHPKDPGGATKNGVTLATFRRYVKADATKAELRAITDEQIATVYYRHYWAAVMAHDLPSGLDYAVFDFAVNSGPDRAAKHLQAGRILAAD